VSLSLAVCDPDACVVFVADIQLDAVLGLCNSIPHVTGIHDSLDTRVFVAMNLDMHQEISVKGTQIVFVNVCFRGIVPLRMRV